MGWREQEAVQDHSRYSETVPENYVPFKIMMAIARRAQNGVSGVAGDPRHCQSIRDIADLAKVHRNSVLHWLPKLKESGELSCESGGGGRGSWSAYTINLELPDGPEMAQGMAQAPIEAPENGTDPQREIIHLLRELAQEMAHVKALLAQLLAQGNGTNGTDPQRGTGQYHKVPEEIPSVPIGGEEKTPAPARRPSNDDIAWGMVLDLCEGDKDHTEAVFRLEKQLAKAAGWLRPLIKAPLQRDKALDDWWRPLAHILELHAWDITATERTALAALTAMRQDSFSPGRPSALTGQIAAIKSGVKARASPSPNGRRGPSPPPINVYELDESGRY